MNTLRDYATSILWQLPPSIAHRVFLAGGALRAFLDGTTVKDYDLFFANREDYEAAVATMRALGWEELPESYPGAPQFLSPKGLVFNLVGFAFLPLAEQLRRFDFRCCAIGAYIPKGHMDSQVTFLHGAFADCIERRLVLQSNNGTERERKRIRHYTEDYGYTVALGCYGDVDALLASFPPGHGGYG